MSGRFSLRNLSLLALVLGVSSIAAADDTAYKLVYKFEPGQFCHNETEDIGEMLLQDAKAQGPDGRPIESKSRHHTQTLKSYRVVTVNENGGAILEPVLEKVRMASQVDDRPIVSFDSTTGEQPPKEFKSIEGTLGRPMARFHVNSTGKLVKVTMLVNDAPQNFTEAAAKADPMINVLTLMPENPVKIGDKWSEKFDMPVSVGSNLSKKLTQKIEMIKSFELIKVEGHIATITVRTNLFSPSEDPEILRQIAQMISSGTIEFDMQEGRVLSKTIKIDEKVVGAFGPQTLLHAQCKSTEKISLKAPTTASNGSNSAPK